MTTNHFKGIRGLERDVMRLARQLQAAVDDRDPHRVLDIASDLEDAATQILDLLGGSA